MSSAPTSRFRTKSQRALSSPSRPTGCSGSSRASSCPPGPTSESATTSLWDRAEAALASALDSAGHEYVVNEGDGAFYGPKIDLHITDSLGRSWQLGTVQLDYSMPERFDLSYTGADNAEHRPVMIHRALMGSYERFIGILIEHYAGVLPFWLAPVQAQVIPVADRHAGFAAGIAERIRSAGLSVDVDDRTESIGRKIRDAELLKIPVMLVVGDREVESGDLSVRERGGGDETSQTVDSLIERLVARVRDRTP